MYERFYGLTEHPFSLTPGADSLFLNENFLKALDQITYAVNRREAFSVLIGDVGTGKTTLCWAVMLRMPQNVRTALILNPLLNIDDLLRTIIQDFGIKPRNGRSPRQTSSSPEEQGLQDASWLDELSRKQLLDELNRFLLEGANDDVRSVLIIDEAQNLSPECLEQLRILSNLETSKRKLLQIVFSGQLELDHKLNLRQLRQLKQRITVRCSLRPLSRDDMVRYIQHRLSKAGLKRSLLFSKGAFRTIYKCSRGYPRLINIICDRALLAGYRMRSWNITSKMTKTAAENLPLNGTKDAFRLFPVFARLTVTGIVSLVLFSGIAYYISTQINHSLPAIYRGKTQPTSEETDTMASEMTPQQKSAEPPKAPVISTSKPLPSSGLLLQVHSLKTQHQADQAVEELRQKGYPAYQRLRTNRDGARWYVVYIGPFEDVEAARHTAEIILERENLQTILLSSL